MIFIVITFKNPILLTINCSLVASFVGFICLNWADIIRKEFCLDFLPCFELPFNLFS